MKLGDFGWAVTKDDLNLRSPEGAGSLWYAPPELNPPVEGVFNKPGERNGSRNASKRSCDRQVGYVERGSGDLLASCTLASLTESLF